MTGQKYLIQFISLNKQIYFWHHFLVQIGNVSIIKASEFDVGIIVKFKDAEYNSTNILTNFNDSNLFNLSNVNILILKIILIAN